MISLREQLQNRLEASIVMDIKPFEVLPIVSYKMPHKFSFITLEEFCDLNYILEDDLTDEHITYFYNHYGESIGLPACEYDATHTHNDWIVENLQSHNYKIVVKRLQKLLNRYVINIDTSKLSEKFTDARIVRIEIDKECNIFNNNSPETFELNNSKLANDINDILKFHNYYITLIYFYENSNVIILEPIQTADATVEVKKHKYVYHITNKDNITNIVKKGLRPRVKKSEDDDRYRYYTERIFLISHSDSIKNDISRVIDDLQLWHNYAILKIDISKLNITYWWDDASSGNTVYTVESIPPKFITVLNNINEL